MTDHTDIATRGYYAETHAIIFVYDITNPETLFDSATWIKDIKIYLNDELNRGLPLLLVGNKSDLVTDMLEFPEQEDGEEETPRPEYATRKQAKNILKQHNLSTKPEPMECSALTGERVGKVFKTIAERLIAGPRKSNWCDLF